MKILKDNYAKNIVNNITKDKQIKPYPRTIICENCESTLEYEKSDTRIGSLGSVFLDCPLCGCENILEGNEQELILTVENIEFPIHFWHTSKENGAVDRCNTDEIRKEIKRAIKYFRKNKDEFSWQTWCGNLFVLVLRYSGDENYEVYVANDFYSTDIPFQSEDY